MAAEQTAAVAQRSQKQTADAPALAQGIRHMFSAACLIAGDEVFAGAHPTVTLETRHVVQLDGNQPSASSNDPAPSSEVAPPEESSKTGFQSH